MLISKVSVIDQDVALVVAALACSGVAKADDPWSVACFLGQA